MTFSSSNWASAAPYRLAADTIESDEIAAAKAVLDSGLLTMGERVREFEREFAAWIGIEHAIMVNSGSSANLLAVDVLLRSGSGAGQLKQGDEVIVPALSWPTTVWPIAQLGLTPVFVDIDPVTLAIDLDSASQALGPRTRAMFLIHALGRAADVATYDEFCRVHDLVLLEDCCESMGAHWQGAHVGTTGLAATFSFYYSHHISTIEGGMVVTSDASVADDLRGLRAHGWIRDRSDRSRWMDERPELDPRFLFATVGYNVRPMELQGAIGRVQLGRLDEMLLARESLARKVKGWLATSAPWIELVGGESLDEPPSLRRTDRLDSWMTLPMRIRPGAPASRDEVMRSLESAGVETRPIIAGNLARHPAVDQIAHRCAPSLAMSDAVLRDTFMIGCHPVLSRESLATLERAIVDLARL